MLKLGKEETRLNSILNIQSFIDRIGEEYKCFKGKYTIELLLIKKQELHIYKGLHSVACN